MRAAFCFSRICSRYSESLLRPRPCSPGGYGRISIGHLDVAHLLPLRNSLVFSRRHRLQSAPVYLAIRVLFLGSPRRFRAQREKVVGSSDATALGRPASVVGTGGHVADAADLEASGLERADRGLAARTRALHE